MDIIDWNIQSNAILLLRNCLVSSNFKYQFLYLNSIFFLYGDWTYWTRTYELIHVNLSGWSRSNDPIAGSYEISAGLMLDFVGSVGIVLKNIIYLTLSFYQTSSDVKTVEFNQAWIILAFFFQFWQKFCLKNLPNSDTASLDTKKFNRILSRRSLSDE